MNNTYNDETLRCSYCNERLIMKDAEKRVAICTKCMYPEKDHYETLLEEARRLVERQSANGRRY